MEDIIDQNVDQQPNNAQPADNGEKGKGGRTFTQEDVDRIVRERLAKDRAKRNPTEPTEEEKRESALIARENRLSCREHLLDSGLPSSLLDAFDTSDIDKFKKAVAVVSGLIVEKARSTQPAPLYSNLPPVVDAPVTGFERGKKHKPKQHPRYSNE